MAKRSTFGSRFGTIMVVGGSVIGLGNIWRFPYVAGENGGAVFIIVYLLVSVFISIPIMLSEFSIGRRAQANSMRAYSIVSGKKSWGLVGYLGIITAFTILSFYCVIAGWGIEMIRQSFAGTYMVECSEIIKTNFDIFVATGWKPAVYSTIFLIATALIVSFGIEKGIEKFNKAAMPVMFFILVGIVVYSASLPGFSDGISFLMRPDFSKLTFGTVLSAMGQSFFSLSLGMGIMVTYGSYIKKKANMFGIAGTVAASDLLVAILSGLAVFPAVFSFGMSPTSGPDLVFLTLPNVFAQMSFGQIIGLMFFIVLFAAAITSSVSLLEVVVAYVHEEWKLTRRKAALVAAAAIFCTSMLCIVSQMPDSGIMVAGMNIFDLFDTVTSLYMLPLGGLLAVLFAGWVIKKSTLREEMTGQGAFGIKLFPVVRFMVRWIIPPLIILLFLSLLGILK